MKLEKLTSEQEAKMLEVKQFWLDYIFSCKNTTINRNAAKIGIDWLYKFVGRDAPIIIYVDSPLGCQYAVAYVKEFVKHFPLGKSETDQVWDQVRDQVGDQVRAQVWDQVRDQVGDQVRDQVRAQVWDQVWDQVRDQVWDQVRDQVRAQVWDQVWDQVRDQVGDQVRAQVWDQVRDQVGDQVGDQVWAQVGDQVRDQVWDQVRDQVWDQVRDQVRAQVWDQIGDQYESFASYGSVSDYGWVSFFDFFTQIGVINHKDFIEFKGILQSGIYDMIQLNGFCIVSSLPKQLSRDARNRLHNSETTAIAFKDGYGQYYWHGVNVPAQWICFPETVTKEDVIKESNAEKRRCLMEILGETRYAELLDLSEIDSTTYNSRQVILFKTKQKDNLINDFIYFIKVICPSTNRNYYICVPKHEDALLALAWTFSMGKEEYKLLIET